MKSRGVVSVIGMILLIMFACGKKIKSEDTKAAAFEIEKEYTSGPCTMTIKIDKKQISIAESITMNIEVIAGKEYNVELPAFGENLNQFKIIDFKQPGKKLLDDKRTGSVQVYKLEPYLSGEYTIPVMRIRFYTDEESSENAHILESEEIPITVTSLLPEDMKELKVMDIAGPVSPPPPDITWVIILAVSILIAGAGAAVLIVRLRSRKKELFTIATISAHKLAYRQLELLVKEDFISRSEFKLFYINISTILRHYIENRFALHAPEQTTEEFLSDLQKSPLLPEALKSILKSFLHHCDLVKFAKHVPETEDIQKTFDTCRDFILKTEDESARIPEPKSIRLENVASQTTEREGN
jgi:hypothetical protein